MNMIVYYETPNGSHAEIAAVYCDCEYPSNAILAEHERIAAEARMIVTEACDLTKEEVIQRLSEAL